MIKNVARWKMMGMLAAMALPAGMGMLLQSCSMQPPSPPLTAAIRNFDPRYTNWNYLLFHYVTPQGVNYAGLQKDQGRLDIALTELTTVTPEQFENWTRDSQLAFLINAHNAQAIARILPHYPVDSLNDTVWIPGSSRTVRNIRLLGRLWSLESLADEITGYPYQESRTMFLIDWGAKGCAPLPPVAVTGQNLQELLERQARAFMTDSRYQNYNLQKHILFVSRLLKWYRSAIDRDYGTLWDFAKRYLPPDEVKKMGFRAQGPRIRFLPFDRSLNDISK
jgi:hypothetical protein